MRVTGCVCVFRREFESLMPRPIRSENVSRILRWTASIPLHVCKCHSSDFSKKKQRTLQRSNFKSPRPSENQKIYFQFIRKQVTRCSWMQTLVNSIEFIDRVMPISVEFSWGFSRDFSFQLELIFHLDRGCVRQSLQISIIPTVNRARNAARNGYHLRTLILRLKRIPHLINFGR